MVSLGTIYSSPGVFDEQLHLFLCFRSGHAVIRADEGEFIETVHMPLEALTRDIMRGKIRDAKTVAIILMANEFLKGNKYRAE